MENARAKLLFFVKCTNWWFSFASCHSTCLSTLWSYGQQRSWFPDWEGACLILDEFYTEIFFFCIFPWPVYACNGLLLQRFVFPFRLRNVLIGVFFLSFHKMHVHVPKTTLERNYSLKCTSRGVKWENKTYKLKTSITPRVLVGTI